MDVPVVSWSGDNSLSLSRMQPSTLFPWLSGMPAAWLSCLTPGSSSELPFTMPLFSPFWLVIMALWLVTLNPIDHVSRLLYWCWYERKNFSYFTDSSNRLREKVRRYSYCRCVSWRGVGVEPFPTTLASLLITTICLILLKSVDSVRYLHLWYPSRVRLIGSTSVER